MADNIFNEKADYLIGARDAVVAKNAKAKEIDELNGIQKKLVKSIAAEEKSIADEIATTVRKRRLDIEDSYDERLDDNRSRKKKVSSKRDKKKAERVSERIVDETKHLNENSNELIGELKTLFKKNKVPSFCASKLYYLMFSPYGTAEFMQMLGCFVVYLVVIPVLIMLLIKKFLFDPKSMTNITIWCIVVFFLFVILQLVIYFIVYNTTKNRHRDIIAEGRLIRNKMRKNKKEADAIKSAITKDKDESIYNLEVFDEKLASLDEEADIITLEKKEALKNFDEEAKQTIIDEINGRRLQALEDMKAEKTANDEKLSLLENEYSDMISKITNQYAAYIGEDMCKEDKLNDLITLMEEGQASTVSEAISVYKGN